MSDVPAVKYCVRCQAQLPSAAQGRCSWCSTEYNTDQPESFKQQRDFLGWKFWFPGFVLAVVSGVLSYGTILSSGEMGFALFLCTPISFGAILGYSTRASIWWAVALGLTAIACVCFVLVVMDFSGIFCGLTLGGIFFAPALVGVTLGWLLRIFLHRSTWDQRHYLPVLFWLSFPFLSAFAESFAPPQHEVAEVRTALTFHSTPQEVWDSIVFFEEIEHEPSWKMKLAMPRPVRTEGRKSQPGDVTRCIYTKGYIVKRITRAEPGRELAFEIDEQSIHFEHDVRLRGGSFELRDLGDGRTEVVLTTRYQRWLRPAAVWQPIEETVIHELHNHVLEGMRLKAESASPPYSPPTPPVVSPPRAENSMPKQIEPLQQVATF